MGCVGQKQPNSGPARPSDQSLKANKAHPQNENAKVQKELQAGAGQGIIGEKQVSVSKQAQQVSSNPRAGDERRQQLLSKYQIDNQQKVPNLPKMHSYNYQTLLVHNPDHNICDNSA